MENIDYHTQQIGCVFTPVDKAIPFFEKYDIFERWIQGDTIFDPTMGNGNLLQAVIQIGLKKGYRIEQLPTQRLFGNELNTIFYQEALNTFQQRYGIDMSEQFSNSDIFDLPSKAYNIVVSNPPWSNFTDLPESYKEKLKPLFAEWDLVRKKKDVLWGGTRIDIAALVIQKVMHDFLVQQGRCYCFVPLSLFLNDGAHQTFRDYQVKTISFTPIEIYDFDGIEVFEGIGTRNGFVVFERDTTFVKSLPFFIFKDNQWERLLGTPLFLDNDPLSVGTEEELSNLRKKSLIEVPSSAQPRQGLNTSGRNNLFFFQSCKEIDSEHVCLGEKLHVPKRWVYPLIVGNNFKEESMTPQKWVLLLHDSKTGKPLTATEVQKSEPVWAYLKEHEQSLKTRKGVMIQSQITKGLWWALLGVGEYSFAPYKIIWEAYGKKEFCPRIIDGRWQANQSLQAFMPVKTAEQAEEILKKFQSSHVEQYLLSMKMKGTQNWAQPGKIKKILSFVSDEQEQLSLF